MLAFAKWVTVSGAAILASLVALVAMAALSMWIVLAILPRAYSDSLEYRFASLLDVELDGYNFPTSSEVFSANRDQLKIGDWVAKCNGIASIRELDIPFQVLFASSGNISFRSDEKAKSISRDELRLGRLVFGISENRKEFDLSAKNSYNMMSAFTFVTISIGLLTTVFISVSSADMFSDKPSLGRAVKILAILFPAIGTAAAAVAAFYSPNDKYFESRQSLAALGQMHRQIANEVARAPCISGASVAESEVQTFRGKLDGWEDQHSAILNAVATREATRQQGMGKSTESGGK